MYMKVHNARQDRFQKGHCFQKLEKNENEKYEKKICLQFVNIEYYYMCITNIVS